MCACWLYRYHFSFSWKTIPRLRIWSVCSANSLNFLHDKSTAKPLRGATNSVYLHKQSSTQPLLTKAAKSFMFCQHLIPLVPLAICLAPHNRGRRMAADCWNAPQWDQLLHVDCVHHGTFERAGLIQFGTAGFPLKKSYPFHCLYFRAFFSSSSSSFTPTAVNGFCKSGCSSVLL